LNQQVENFELWLSFCEYKLQQPNNQMQKTGAGVACQGDAALPASDLERSKDWGMTVLIPSPLGQAVMRFTKSSILT
jgi:hypothetical protein